MHIFAITKSMDLINSLKQSALQITATGIIMGLFIAETRRQISDMKQEWDAYSQSKDGEQDRILRLYSALQAEQLSLRNRIVRLEEGTGRPLHDSGQARN